MKEKWNPNVEFNENLVAIGVFLAYYNQHIPTAFPQATLRSLKAFKKAYPALFPESELWSIDKHRKRVMDWLPSYKEDPEEV